MQTADGGRTWSEVSVTPSVPSSVTGNPSGAAEQAGMAFIQAMLAHDVSAMQGLLLPDRKALAQSRGRTWQPSGSRPSGGGTVIPGRAQRLGA